MNWLARHPRHEKNLLLPVYDEKGGAFAALRDRRVLIYWPHGFGDFVHFGFVAPMLEPSNEYFITRFGDDFVHLYDEGEVVAPLYSGKAAIGDGSQLGARHLGVDFKKIHNRDEKLSVPEPLLTRIRDAGIDTILYTDYPEYAGNTSFPYHTKARALARDLISAPRLQAFDLAQPLHSSLRFVPPEPARSAMEERIRKLLHRDERLYLIAPGGHTNASKTWPASEVEHMEKLLRMRDPQARPMILDEASIQRRFGDLELPFAHVIVSLIRASEAFIGVPSGPLHAALAIGGRPIVGIWLAHHPDWYDEPCASAIHLVGPEIYRKKWDQRPASHDRPEALANRIVPCTERPPSAADALDALDEVADRR